MKAKAAVTYEKGVFTFDDIEVDNPKADEVLVKIVASGVCHTDVGGRDGILPFPLPGVLGHEGAGVVERVGDAVKGIKPGDHVVLSYAFCGHCDNCEDGHPGACESWPVLNFMGKLDDGSTRLHKGGQPLSVFFGQSSFATYAVANQRQCVVVDPDVDLTYLGPLGCGFLTGAGTVLNVLRPSIGDSIAIFGPGAVGQAAVMAAKISEARNIIVIGRNQSRLDTALEVGATHIINSRETDPVEEVRKITGGRGCKCVLDTTGVEQVVRQAIDSTSGYGTMCTVAMSGDSITLGIEADIMGPGRCIRGAIEGDAVAKTFIPHLVDYFKQGRFPIDKLCKVYEFEEIDQAFADSKNGVTIKPILKMPV